MCLKHICCKHPADNLDPWSPRKSTTNNIKKESVNLRCPIRSALSLQFSQLRWFFLCVHVRFVCLTPRVDAPNSASQRPTYCARSAKPHVSNLRAHVPTVRRRKFSLAVSGSVGRWSAIRGGGSSAFGGRGLAIVLRDVRHVATATAAAVKFVCFCARVLARPTFWRWWRYLYMYDAVVGRVMSPWKARRGCKHEELLGWAK